ncbi:MAG: hypothetical protein GX121_09620 [Ignavibacteria bacterium]|nr:hypothetical protein [Ignavibacteria bacterium]
MLEVRKNTFTRSYENTFFRDFSKHLSKAFDEKEISGLLIGSPLCEPDERLQIDALLITEHVVCIIDFKNYSGLINLPIAHNFEFGLWTNKEGEHIKGGSSINPYIQLKNQKSRFSEVFEKNIKEKLFQGDYLDCSHIVCVVCFQKEIELNRGIPNSKELAFWIIDKLNFVEKIFDIIDVSNSVVNISQKSYDAFKNVFRADKYKIEEKPLEDKLKIYAEKSTKLDDSLLYPDQKAALSKIESFLVNSEQNVFILQGTANSGKTFLIPYIQDIAFQNGIHETEIFAQSNRVANNLVTIDGLERVNSIYSYIYGGQKNNGQEEKQINGKDINQETDEEIDSENLKLEEIPLKNCDNAENALFIVDESQLVSDSFYQSIDLIFGTGYLLKDFLSYTNSINTKRKIIFIGDPFLLQLGKTDESPLNSSYLEQAYSLKTNVYPLSDKPDFSDINKEALLCIEKIRIQYFNSLHFETNDNFCFLSKEDVLKKISDVIINKIDCHMLCFSNEESQKVNYWIKKLILKNGNDIAISDLVLFNNNIETATENDPFAQPKKIYNGQFGVVEKVSSDCCIKESKNIKGEITSIEFREITIALAETGDKVKVLSLENYRLNPKAELSKNELILFKRILSRELSKAKINNPFNNSYEYKNLKNDNIFNKYEKENNLFLQQLLKGTSRKKNLTEEEKHLKILITNSKENYKRRIEINLRNNPTSEYNKLKNAALLRYGWALTVHKSMSYKWNEVIFNVNPGENVGKTNQQHFKWLYTGISRAKQKISLINYKPITPFDKTDFVDESGETKVKEFLFISDNKDIEIAKNELINVIKQKLNNEYVINQIEIHGWNVRIIFSYDLNETIMEFSFDKKHQFKFPKFIKGDKDLASSIKEKLKKNINNNAFESIADLWRKNEYSKLANVLTKHGINLVQIIQTNYKDRIKLFNSENEELDLEIDYKKEGYFSKITAKYYSSPTIWEKLKDAINKIKA